MTNVTRILICLNGLAAFALCSGSPAFAQNPQNHPSVAVEIRHQPSQPVIGYTLEVDLHDLSSYKVVMRVRHAADTFRIAMMAHPEYDDRFWRFVRDLRVETAEGNGTVLREDSALWRIVARGEELTIHYTIHLPTPQQGLRAAWRPFLSPTGGLVGGPHSFMYIVGATLAPAYVTLKIPQGWKSATGLEGTLDAATFFAPSVSALVDSPILIGQFRSWPFSVDQVPHRVLYWPMPNAVPFDTLRLVHYIRKFVEQATALFGRLPYKEYTFILQDGAYGALEHANSATLGVSSSELAKNVASYLGGITHEYFHTWNLVRIRPVEFGDVTYKTPPLSKGLWWSEGMTMFYADLLSRRAGIPRYDSSRVKHVEQLMSQYYSEPGNSKILPEQASLAAFGPPGRLGDDDASTHLQGELLGTMLDLIVRDATDGKHSIDEVMEKMMVNYSGAQGFTNQDVENLIQQTCGCIVEPFFRDYFYGGKPIDFDKFLALAGMRIKVSWKDAVDDAGKPSPDVRIYAFQSPGEKTVKLGITDPSSCWGRAGIHTGDGILSVNKTEVKSASDFRREIRKAKIGDHVSLKVTKPTGGIKLTVVTVAGYRRAEVQIELIKEATGRQRKIQTAWITGAR